MNKEDLQKKNRDDLKEISTNLGLDVGQVGKKKIIALILEATGGVEIEAKEGAAPHIQDEVKEDKAHTAVQNFKKLKPLQKVSREAPKVAELKKELAPYTERGLKVVSLDDDCWHFSIRGREDSGSTKQPLQNIIKCVRLLMKK